MTRAYDIQNDLSSARTDAPLAIAFAMFRASMFADDLAERKQYLWVANVFTGLHEQMVVQYSLHKALNFYTGRAISVMKNLLHAMVMQGSFPSDFTPETTYPSTVLPETPVTEWIERPGFANFYLTSRLPFQFQVDYRKRNPEKWGGLWSLLIQRGPLGQSVFVSEVLHNKYPAGFAWDNYPTRMQWLAGFFRGLQHSENLEAAPYGGQTISPAGEKRPWECIACPKPEPSPTPQKIAPGQFPLEIKVRDPAESGGTAFFVTAPATKKFVVPLGSMKCDRNLYPGGCVAAKADVQYQLRANVPASDGIFQDFYRWEPAYAKPSSPRLPSSCLSGYPVAPWNSGACQLPKGVLLTRLTAKYRDNSLKVHAEAPVTLPGPMLRTTAIFRDTDTEFRKSCVATSKDEACIHKRAVTVPATQQAIISAQDSFYSGQTQYLFDKWKFLDENGVAIPALEHGMGYFCIDAQRRCIIPSRNAPAQIRPRVRHIIATYKEAPITCQIQILSGGIPNAPIPTTVTLQATYSPRVPSSVYSGGQGIGWTVTVDGTGNSQMGTRRGIYGDFIINQRNSSMSSGRTYTFKHTFGVDPQDFCVTAVVQPPQTIACRLKRGNLLTSNASTFEVYTEFYSMESGTTVTPPPELVTAKPEYWTWSVNGVTQSDNGRAGPRPVTGALYFPTRRFNVNKNTSGMPRNISVQYMTLPGAPYQFECSHTETQPAASSGGGYSSPASGGGGVVTTGSSSAGQNQNPAPGCYGALCECRPKATHTCPPGNRDVLGDGQHYCCP